MFDTEETRTKNVRKFSNIFDIHAGPSWNPHAKPPKMKDNYETVTVEEMGEDGEFSFQLEGLPKCMVVGISGKGTFLPSATVVA